jgi:hypothetical protein
MSSRAFNALAISLILVWFTMSHTIATPLLGGNPQHALNMFSNADAKCRNEQCRQRGRYGLGTKNGRTNVLYYTWAQSQPVSLEESRKIAREMIPEDAQRVRSITKNDGSLVEVYSSQSLANTFGVDPEAWMGAKAGTFVVFHSISLRKTIISVGDYP